MTASTHTDPLLSLARHCGLTEFYSDIYGTRHVTPEETRRALLAAITEMLRQKKATQTVDKAAFDDIEEDTSEEE